MLNALLFSLLKQPKKIVTFLKVHQAILPFKTFLKVLHILIRKYINFVTQLVLSNQFIVINRI